MKHYSGYNISIDTLVDYTKAIYGCTSGDEDKALENWGEIFPFIKKENGFSLKLID